MRFGIDETVSALRQVAYAMEQTPEIGWFDYHTFYVHVDTADELVAAAKAIGGKWEKSRNDYDYELRQRVGDSSIRIAIYTARDNICTRVEEGEEEYEVPDTDSEEAQAAQAVLDALPKVTKTRPKVTWECPPSVLALTKRTDDTDEVVDAEMEG